MTELRMYEYRLYPSIKQKERLLNQFKICKEIYNTLLSMNKNLMIASKFDFNSLVMDIKLTCPEYYSQVHSQVLQNVSDRLHKAFDSFFRRVKEKQAGKMVKAGYPRFKSRIYSITYPQSGFKMLSDKRLRLSKIGDVPIVLHRIPRGEVKTLTIKHNKVGQWFAVFSVEVPEIKVVNANDSKIGIDVGLENFATFNDGVKIENPRFLRASEERLKKLQRRVSRKVKGSQNREKAIHRLAVLHLKVRNQRKDWLHKLSRTIVNNYSFVAVEKLNINNMLKNHCLAKSISDASWGSFIQMLEYKAITSNSTTKKSPKTRGSSKRCSECGTIAEMTLSKRIFKCSNCGLLVHRDLNASNNILNDTLGLREISTLVETPPLPSVPGKVSGVVEAGTICKG